MGGGPRFLFGLALMGDVPAKAGGAYRFDVGCTRLRLIVGMVLVDKRCSPDDCLSLVTALFPLGLGAASADVNGAGTSHTPSTSS